MRRHLLVFALCILPFFPAQAATYYVDAKNGNDGNGGTSPSSAWKSLEKINTFQFQPGDSILFKRGEIWREQLNFPSSGAEGRPIVLDAYGSGDLPVISGADVVAAGTWNASPTANVWQANVGTEPNVVIFDSVKGNKQAALENLKQQTDWFWSAGTLYAFASSNPAQAFTKSGVEAGTRMSAINLSGKTYIALRNIQVSGANAAPYALGSNIWAIAPTRKGPPPGHLEISHCVVVNSAGDGIHLEGASGSRVDANLVANNENVGIQIYRSLPDFSVSDVDVSNNEVHHNKFIGINMAGCPAGTSCRTVKNDQQIGVTKVRITGNRSYNNGAGIYLHQTTDSLVSGNVSYANLDTSRKGEGYCVGLSGSSSNIVEKNECYQAAHAGIELSIDISKPAVGSSSNIIRYNVVHDNGSNGLMTDYHPSENNKFLYNIVYNHPNGSCIFANNTGHMFFNNTCYNNRFGIYLYVSKTTPETGNISIKNNIIAGTARQHIVIEPGVQLPVELANNEYFPDDAQKFNLRSSLSDLSGWKAKTGQDANSFAADPRFAAAAPAGPNDFRLQDGSPAIGRGAQTEFAESLAADLKWPQIVRVTKQQQRWDLGAIQHGTGPEARR
jgi:parallel beta-helix repeat protein